MILIATHERDVGADFVIRHLVDRRATFIRVDTNTLGTPERHFGFENEAAYLKYDDTLISADRISAVWARRFASPSILERVHPDYRAFIARELMDVMEGFLDTVRAPFMNNYDADRKAGNRLVQSTIARAVGFSIPESIVTQDALKAKTFMRRHSKTITKAISFGIVSAERDQIAHTSRINNLSSLAGLAGCPSLIQPEIKKKCEWRVTTVGHRLFSARTKGGARVDQLDWRRSDDVSGIFEKADLPRDVSEKLLLLCDHSKITFGAHDLIESPEDEFYFLETNPAGQWGWLEVALGLPIGEAIAAWLISAGGRN
jgi:glutathione synthase/RimK-type ligase-like ATP-grasp enzyme